MNNLLDFEKINGQELSEKRNVETIRLPPYPQGKDSLSLIKKTFISKLKERAEKLCSLKEECFTKDAWELLREEARVDESSVVEPFGGWSMLREPSPKTKIRVVIVAQNPYKMQIIPRQDTKLTDSDVCIIWAAKYIVSARDSKSSLPELDAMRKVKPCNFSNKEFHFDSCMIINALPFRTFCFTDKIDVYPGAIPSVPESAALGKELVERILAKTQPEVVLTLGDVARSIIRHISEFRGGDAEAKWLHARHPSRGQRKFRTQLEEGVKILIKEAKAEANGVYPLRANAHRQT
jgi:hypothetical protein